MAPWKTKMLAMPGLGVGGLSVMNCGRASCGFVAVMVAGDAVDVAAVGFAPACSGVSWQVDDESGAVNG